MTTFSFVVIPICLLLLAVRYKTPIQSWILNLLNLRQNDCPQGPSDVKGMAPYPAQPIRGRERYRVMMDIRKLDVQNWLTLDKNYMEEHRVRDQLLREKKDTILQCLPESRDCCQEALEEVSQFLCERFPSGFQKANQSGEDIIENRMTGEKFNITSHAKNGSSTDALEAAVRLTMEDLSVLMLNEDGEYYL